MAKTETIEAYRVVETNGVKTKEKCGETEWNRPETIQEMLDEFDNEEILKSFCYGFVVREQDRIRRPMTAKKPMTENERTFAKLSPEQQNELLKQIMGESK